MTHESLAEDAAAEIEQVDQGQTFSVAWKCPFLKVLKTMNSVGSKSSTETCKLQVNSVLMSVVGDKVEVDRML